MENLIASAKCLNARNGSSLDNKNKSGHYFILRKDDLFALAQTIDLCRNYQIIFEYMDQPTLEKKMHRLYINMRPYYELKKLKKMKIVLHNL